ncbi:hypothetical protein [Endozoicomonas numazuensis]|nr:hypothetical protein [Endozoicomonas numazuensis]
MTTSKAKYSLPDSSMQAIPGVLPDVGGMRFGVGKGNNDYLIEGA